MGNYSSEKGENFRLDTPILEDVVYQVFHTAKELAHHGEKKIPSYYEVLINRNSWFQSPGQGFGGAGDL